MAPDGNLSQTRKVLHSIKLHTPPYYTTHILTCAYPITALYKYRTLKAMEASAQQDMSFIPLTPPYEELSWVPREHSVDLYLLDETTKDSHGLSSREAPANPDRIQFRSPTATLYERSPSVPHDHSRDLDLPDVATRIFNAIIATGPGKNDSRGFSSRETSANQDRIQTRSPTVPLYEEWSSVFHDHTSDLELSDETTKMVNAIDATGPEKNDSRGLSSREASANQDRIQTPSPTVPLYEEWSSVFHDHTGDLELSDQTTKMVNAIDATGPEKSDSHGLSMDEIEAAQVLEKLRAGTVFCFLCIPT